MSEKSIFNNEWKKRVNRFKIIVGLTSLDINLKHPQTQKLAQPYEAIPEIFAQWQQIESPWDKQSLIFEAIYQIIGQYMKPWSFIYRSNHNFLARCW